MNDTFNPAEPLDDERPEASDAVAFGCLTALFGVVSLVLGIIAVWTGDLRWGYTAILCLLPGLVTLLFATVGARR